MIPGLFDVSIRELAELWLEVISRLGKIASSQGGAKLSAPRTFTLREVDRAAQDAYYVLNKFNEDWSSSVSNMEWTGCVQSIHQSVECEDHVEWSNSSCSCAAERSSLQAAACSVSWCREKS